MRNSAYVALSASLCFTAGSVTTDLAGNYRLSVEIHPAADTLWPRRILLEQIP
ncbi:MAG: hypothetical protein P8163_12400 [Candidatus Thiodiazotropha sp.]